MASSAKTGWLYQLCSTMIFNHDPPMCVGCKDCGGPSRCGMGCSALVSNKIDGYPGPQTFETVGFCDCTTHLKHPSGCAKIISSHGKGLGWFGTLMIFIFCLFGVYLLAGTIYRQLQTWNSGLAYPIEYRICLSRWCGDLEDHHMVTGAPILPLIFDNVIARDYFDQFLICVCIGNSACHCGSISFTSIGLYSTKAICLDRGSSPYPFCWIDLTLEGTFTTVCEMSIIQTARFYMQCTNGRTGVYSSVLGVIFDMNMTSGC